jgi:hypothetical protein
MTYLLITLGLSLFFLLLMIAYRSYELSYNKELISREKINVFDKKLLTFYDKNIILLNRFYDVLRNLPMVSSHKIHDLWEGFSKTVDSRFEKIKRSKSENNKGSVSIYWKSVSQVKRSNKSIEE